ncbi:gag-pol polyprotein [Tanacetum coccineum]
MVSKSLEDWDIKLLFAEFSYNHSPTYVAGHDPFEVNYEVNPLMPIDLVPFHNGNEVHFEVETRTKEMLKIHEQVKKKIVHANDLYKKKANKHRKKALFEPEDLVLERTGDNAYKLELPGDLKISATFNVEDLSPYFEDGPLENLRTNSSQPGGVDAGAS